MLDFMRLAPGTFTAKSQKHPGRHYVLIEGVSRGYEVWIEEELVNLIRPHRLAESMPLAHAVALANKNER